MSLSLQKISIYILVPISLSRMFVSDLWWFLVVIVNYLIWVGLWCDHSGLKCFGCIDRIVRSQSTQYCGNYKTSARNINNQFGTDLSWQLTQARLGEPSNKENNTDVRWSWVMILQPTATFVDHERTYITSFHSALAGTKWLSVSVLETSETV